MKIDGIIFDLDGTLWDCIPQTVEASNFGFKTFGVDRELDYDFVASITGRPADEVMELILEGVNPTIKHDLTNLMDSTEYELIKERASTALYNGVAENLEKLAKRYPLFLVSNCGVEYLNSFLKHSGVGHLFSGSECYGNTKLSKDQNIKIITKKFGLKVPCYVGDTHGDQIAAERAEVTFVYMSYGFGKCTVSELEFSDFSLFAQWFLR